MVLLPLLTMATTRVDPPDVLTPGAAITLTDLENIIQRISNFMVIVSVLIAVIFIIYGGIRYMTAGGEPKRAEEARKVIFNGIIGAGVVLGVGVILNTVKVILARQFFSGY